MVESDIIAIQKAHDCRTAASRLPCNSTPASRRMSASWKEALKTDITAIQKAHECRTAASRLPCNSTPASRRMSASWKEALERWFKNRH